MAKYEKTIVSGNFAGLLQAIDDGILNGSASASYEGGSDFTIGGVRCAVRVYERYSMLGGNRVSLNVTLLSDGNYISVSAITSGGSEAVFFKINTLGESSFLDQLIDVVEAFQ